MKYLVIIGICLWATVASAVDHFCLVFSVDSIPPHAAASHVFATFAETDNDVVINNFTISWGPKNNYHFRDGAVPGQNNSLFDAVSEPLKAGRQVCMWGPYKITDAMYSDAEKRFDKLNTKFSYKFFDSRTRDKNAVNCIHAVADIPTAYDTGLKYGQKASAAIVQHYQDCHAIIDKQTSYDFLLKPLKLDQFKTTRR